MDTFGEFLYALRKEKGLTQAALAELLGVTNKAVSKWETGEAMPESGLLKPISEIFGVTVDELLNGKRAEPKNEPDGEKLNKSDKEDKIDGMAGHMFTRGKDEPQTLLDKICGVVCATVMPSGITAYLLLGAIAGLWHPYWVLIPVCAFGCGIIGIIFNLCDRQKREYNLAKGKNPYTDGACGLVMLCSLIAYMLCGALGNLWHPYWVIIIVAVAVDGIVGSIGNLMMHKK